ncbi:outer membrane lipoprotein Blc [Edaphovirga cremea]|uniref:outer membrane lipoprotein Blc n=1 Tax=Edaphovirga cremea TaxID=2267246 RepID=UPI000DEF21D1|nr:outer membrane lipoprotein Blc [Edaphovirga cremea]
MRIWSRLCVMMTALLSVACSVKPPPDVEVVNNFEVKRYLGIWYEIARLDHRFERGLDHVTANYSTRDDGGIRVINRGFNVKKQEWEQSEGKGYFIGSPAQASLKVSFFGPFYGGYNVIELDKEYRYALVCGPNKDYLWILSRTPTLDEGTREKLLETARKYGFDTDKLIWVNQS